MGATYYGAHRTEAGARSAHEIYIENDRYYGIPGAWFVARVSDERGDFWCNFRAPVGATMADVRASFPHWEIAA